MSDIGDFMCDVGPCAKCGGVHGDSGPCPNPISSMTPGAIRDALGVMTKDALDGSPKPCRICGKPMGDHDDVDMDDCWTEIEARDRRKQISLELITLGAITRETLAQNWWNADMSKVQESPLISQLFGGGGNTSFFLWGPCGTGKTYQARCMLNEAMKFGKRVVDINAIALAKMLRTQFNQHKLVDCCKNFSVLLIDDIDKAFWKEREIEGLWEIINVRCDRGLKTIITSNIYPKEFGDMIAAGCGGNHTRSQSLFQRLHPCLMLEFEGESLR